MSEIQYKNKKPNTLAMKKFGFVKKGDTYEYKTEILDGELEIIFFVNGDGVTKTKIFDTVTGDEYVLHLVNTAQGSYVGSVRDAQSKLLSRIYDECFENVFFAEEKANAVIEYIAEKYGEKMEFPWDDENSIVRHKNNGKWYAVFMKISARKIGWETDEVIEVINVKMKPEDVELLVDFEKYYPAYHMNKKHWVTIPFDSSIMLEELISKIDDSYRLTE